MTTTPADPNSAAQVPAGWPMVEFRPAAAHRIGELYLERLCAVHNERDHAAWMSSIEHIHATPGFQAGSWSSGDPWPYEMSLDDNLADMHMHDRHFEHGEGFTYSVLDGWTSDGGDVIGCVYVYPDRDAEPATHTFPAARVRSWVRASHAHLDEALWLGMQAWIAADWPPMTQRWPGR
jgi:hypothetical protein